MTTTIKPDAKPDRFKSNESRERSLRNLKPWNHETAPRNGGRRPKNVFERELELALKARVPNDREERSFYRKIAQALTKSAAQGNVHAAELLLNRMCGKVRSAEEIDNTPPSKIVVMINRNQPRDFSDRDETDGNFEKKQ